MYIWVWGTVGPEKSNYTRRKSKKVLLCRNRMKGKKDPFCKLGWKSNFIGDHGLWKGISGQEEGRRLPVVQILQHQIFGDYLIMNWKGGGHGLVLEIFLEFG